MNIKVGIIQMNIEFGSPEHNRTKVAKAFSDLANKNYDLILLPELWTTGYDLTRLDEISDKNAEESIAFIQGLAKKYQVDVIGGSVANQKEDGVYNTMIVINRNGELIHEYSKLHLFKLMDEHHHLEAGKDSPSFTLANIKFGGFICYDIRFPEWIRKPVLEGATVLVVVAEWPTARIDHWITLLRARAIENQSYVIACNRVGADPNNTFGGNSMIIDPWGEMIAQGSDQEEIVSGIIDAEKVAEIRTRIPIFDDRRPSFYN
ncbi:carbon-nitrogen family hydrolase [Jeotgalibacillus soli]|uniref:Hydrolase n=1 Tax=Jeotgalibacillus soli TaxID=889306 RepID=A0A0C2VA70_9BACL|nr:carbon-nitrogen family hydrolase [Jeotgalibacillus soli]KIL45867.1 hydrolase [Jeotgalibacillus soli]